MRFALALASCSMLACATAVPDRAESAERAAADVVTELYELVTFEAGTTPDWDAVRALFLDEAVVVLRTGRDEMTVFSLEGFVDDFVQFIEQAGVQSTGFSERILDLEVRAFGDMAQVFVRFESHVPGSGRPPGEGLDSFELIRRDGQWRIVSIVNERPGVDDRIPRSLFR